MLFDYKVPKVGDKIFIKEMNENFKTIDTKCEIVKNIELYKDMYYTIEYESGFKMFWNNIFLNNLSGVVSKKQHIMENVCPIDCTCQDYMAYGYNEEDIDNAIKFYKNGIIIRASDEIKKINKEIKKLKKILKEKQDIIDKLSEQ